MNNIRTYQTETILLCFLMLTAVFLQGEETGSSTDTQFVQTIRANGKEGFYRAARLFPEKEYGISVAGEKGKVPFFRISPYEIGVYHQGGVLEYSVEYSKDKKDDTFPLKKSFKKTKGGLNLSVRAMKGTVMRELSHKLTHYKGKELIELVHSLNTGKVTSREWSRINDYRNPFGGRSYVSIYSGIILCPVKGAYTFATDSADGSILALNGKPVIEWGGRHGPAGNWSHARSVMLKPGFYTFFYSQYSLGRSQRASAAWKKPGAKQFTVFSSSDFFTFSDAETIKLTDPDKKEIGFPDIEFEDHGIVFKDTIMRKITFSKKGDMKNGTPAWTIQEKEYKGEKVELYLSQGEEISYSLKGYPAKICRIKVPETKNNTKIDADLQVGGSLPVVYADEEFSIWLRVERSIPEIQVEYTIREERENDASKYRKKESSFAFGLDPDLPQSVQGIKSLQYVYSPNEVSSGSKTVYTLMYETIEVDQVEVKFFDETAPLNNIEVHEDMYRKKEKGKTSIAVFVSKREDQSKYRKWVFVKWLKKQLDSKKSKVLLIYEPLGKDDTFISIFKHELNKHSLTVKKAGDDIYPLLHFPFIADEVLSEGECNAVILFPGRLEIDHGLPVWIFRRIMDLTVTRIRIRHPKATIIIMGPQPVYGREKRIVEINKRLALFSAKHRVIFINTYKEMGNEKCWPCYYSKNKGKDVLKYPTEKGMIFLCSLIKKILD